MASLAAHSDTVAVVTGSTSGLGEQIARELLAQAIPVVGIGRRAATLSNPLYQHLRVDLAETFSASFIEQLQEVTQSADALLLVNNAGIVTPVAGILELDWQEWRHHFAVNVEAPMHIAQLLLQKPRRSYRLGHISSGASQKPYAGWGAYCSGKAALNMAMQVLYEELGHRSAYRNRLSILDYRPGPIATPMQAIVRSSQSPYFASRDRFEGLFQKGDLYPIAEVALDFVTHLLNPDVSSGYRTVSYAP